MAYVGNQAQTAFTSFDKQTITGDGTAVYTLSHSVANNQEIEVFVNNVRQEGGSGKAYTVSGNQITFSENIASTDDCYVVFQGKALQTVVPPAGSVTDSMITGLSSSKLTGALPAIDGSALTGISAGSNILEQLFIIANGESVTVPSGTYTIGDVTAELLLTNSWVDIPSSSISYTPPSGATYVTYNFNYTVFGMNSHMVTHHRFYIDSDEVTQTRRTIQGSGGGYDMANVNWKWGIAIGGSADTASGRQSSWTSAKTLKLQARNYTSSYRGALFAMDYWDGGSGTYHTRPTMQITAYK